MIALQVVDRDGKYFVKIVEIVDHLQGVIGKRGSDYPADKIPDNLRKAIIGELGGNRPSIKGDNSNAKPRQGNFAKK